MLNFLKNKQQQATIIEKSTLDDLESTPTWVESQQRIAQSKRTVQILRQAFRHGVLPVVGMFVLIFGLGYIFITVSVEKATEIDLNSEQVSNELDTSKLDGITFEENVRPFSEVVFNKQIVLNGAAVLTPSSQPEDAVEGQLYYDSETNALRYFDGSSFQSIALQNEQDNICFIGTDCGFLTEEDLNAANGVSSLNGLAGALSIVGSANQLSVNATGTTITLSTPQDLSTNSSVSFGTLTLSGLGAFNGNILLQSGDTLTVNGDAISDLTGSGLVVSSGQLQASLGSDITSGEIVDGTVTNTDLASSSVTVTAGSGLSGGGSVSLGGSVVLTSALGTDIDSGEILNGTIVTADIAVDAITSGLIDDGTITATDLASATILFSNIAQNGCSNNDIMKWNGSAWACAADATGGGINSFETVIAPSGTNPVADSSTDSLSLSAGSGVTILGDGTTDTITIAATLGTDITSAEIVDSTIVSADIADGTIAFADIANNSCANNDIFKFNGSAWYCGTDTDTDTTLNEVQVEAFIFDGDNTGTLTSGTVALDSISYTGTLDDININDALTISSSGSVADGALSANVSLFGASVDSSEITNGTVTGTDLASATILFSNIAQNGCSNNDIMKWNGSAWACAADADIDTDSQNIFQTINADNGTDPAADSATDTLNVVSGSGVTITGDSTTDTLTIAAVLGVDITSAEIVDGTIVSADIADGTITGTDISDGSIANGDLTNSSLTVTAGTGLTGGGLVSLGGTVTLNSSLGTSVDLTTEITGTLAVGNGGTGATTTQGAINALSQLTTEGDLLYYDGVNSTRFARGSAGQCLLSNSTTLLWGSCAGSGTTFFTIQGTSGTPQAITGGDTVTIAAGSNLTTTAGATDTVTVAVVSNPTFSGLITAQAGLTVSAAQAFTINGDAFTDLTGTGLTVSGGALSIDNTLCTTAGNCAGVGGTGDILNNGQNGSVRIGSNDANSTILESGGSDRLTITSAGAATFSGALNVTGLTTLNGDLTIQAGDTFTFNSDAFTDLTGTGLILSGGALQTSLGTSIDLTTEVTGTLPVANGGTNATTTQGAINNISQLTTNGDLLYFNGTNSTRLARGSNGDCLTSNGTTILWGSCAGSGTTFFTLQGTSGSPQSINGGDTVTIAAGSNITTTASATDTVTVAVSSSPNFSGSVTAGTGLTVSAGGATITGNSTNTGTLTVNTSTATEDQIRFSVASGGAGRFTGTITNADLTADQTYTLPNSSGTLCTTAGNCAGVGGTGDILNNGQNGSVRIGSNDANSTILESGGSDRLTITSAGAATFSGALNVTGLTTLNGDLTIQAGDTFTFNSDAFTDLTGTGLILSGGALQTSLGTSIDLTTEVTGTLPVANGGTNATTTQGAINNISQLTTNGDLLYFNGTNSTRLARGSNGDCLTSNGTTILWGSCAGSGTTFFTLQGTSGSPQSINGGDTVTIAAGSNITTTASATDTVTVAVSSSPNFSGSVTAGTGLTVSAGGATITGNSTNTGTLTVNTSTATEDQIRFSVASGGAGRFTGTITNADLTADQTYTLPNSSGTLCTTAGNCAGVGGTGDILNNGQNGSVRIGSNDANSTILESGGSDRLTITSAGAATFSGALNVTGLTTLNGDLTIQAGDTFTFNSDAFTDLTGTGLILSGGALQTSLGTSIDLTTEVTGTLPVANGGTNATTTQGAINNISQLTTNGDLLYFNGTNSTRLARGSNGDCLTSNGTTILWGSCAGSGTTFFTLQGTSGSPQSINGGDTVTIAAGSNITTTASATDTVTVAVVSNPTFSGLVTAQAGLTVEGSALAINSDSITSDGATLTINAAGAVDIQDTVTADGLTIDAAAATAVNISNTGTTTDLSLQNGETIDNNTDGTILLTSTTVQTTGDLAVNGGDITTNQTTATVLNTTATTVSAFGAATSLNLGASGGAATLGNGGAYTVQGSNNQALTLQTQGSGALTLNSANGTIGLGAATTALQKSGTALTIDVNSGSSSTLTVDNAGAGNVTLVVGSGSDYYSFSQAGGQIYFGTARPVKAVKLSPEYQNATLTPDTSNYTGTLTSDFCSGTSRLTYNTSVCGSTDEHNYYSWTTSETGAQQTYNIWVRYTLPSDFSAFENDNTLQFVGWRENSSDNVTVNTYRSTASASTVCGTGGSLSTTNTWQTVTLGGSETGCSFVAGDTLLFKVTVSAQSSRFVRVSDLLFSYYAKF